MGSAVRRAVVASGNLIDAANRPAPRFPPRVERRVAAAIDAHLDAWGIGERDVVLTQGARGTDILVAEAALARGARSIVLLASAPESFIRSSVALPNSDWEERFHAVLGRSEVDVQAPIDDEVEGYRRNNERALQLAVELDEQPHVLTVEGGEGVNAGGTDEFVAAVTALGLGVTRVDPTRAFRYDGGTSQGRERAGDGPKRLLALDGGGMRGLISTQILRRMEVLLGGGDPSYRLSDTFDYVAGTSTGAIIAAGIAMGHPVIEIENMYVHLGPKIFKKRWLPAWWRAMYRDHPVSDELMGFFGESTKLGDERLRSLLMMVLHRADTDSVWPLTNVSGAKYNDRSRYDCNLNMNLWQIIRGSTAAPFYFPPEEVPLPTADGATTPALFEDGGVTPFNNPAILLFEMATSGRYGLRWATGADDLLLTSVGTGLRPAVDGALAKRKTNILFHARKLPTVFMNGSNIEGSRLCQVLGVKRHAPVIDAEFDDDAVVDQRPDHPAFSYVRYNADISPRALERIDRDIQPDRVAKLDAASKDDIAALKRIGADAAAQVRIGHFAGFLP
jgi:hypothetical protein